MKKNMKTDSSIGLTSAEASFRLKQYGENALPEEKRNTLLLLLSYFWGPIPWMIEVASILSAIVHHWWDFTIIVVMLFINAGVGFWQEYKANNAIALLKARLALTARVLRDGQLKNIPARELVPGDLVIISLGNIVPADIKLVSGNYLSVDQSALTGESLPVDKKVGDVIYSTSIVRLGEMKGIVINTGGNTYCGKTAQLVEAAGAISHFRRAILNIGNFLIFLTISLITLILIVAFFRHTPFLEVLQFGLILTVAAIPVALPAVLSVTMAVGAEKLAKMKTIVSRLVAIEELAGMDVLCSDKTGTLTQNKLTIGEPWCFTGVGKEELLLEGALCSNKENVDAIDHAIIEAGGTLPDNYEILHLEPFDPVKKHMLVELCKEGNTFSLSKGAPQIIAKMCGCEDVVMPKVETFAADGYRTIGVARKTNDTWQFRGLIPLFDPPRKDAASTLNGAKKMGIFIKMITGDHSAIAHQIATKLHLGKNIVSASKLFDDGLKDEEIDSLLNNADVIAEVFPEHKYNIVKRLQKQGHVVGMTGDGVNDAPALKQADVGIAVSGATDAARAAADLVLTGNGISVIIDAIAEARRIFHRMISYAVFRISETVRVVMFMTLSILVYDFYPVTAIMIVLLALLNDFPIMMIAFDNTAAPEKPVRWNMHRVLTIAAMLGTMGVISSFLLFWYAEFVLHLDRPIVQTLIFLKLLVAGHLTLYIARSNDWMWKQPWPSLKLITATEITQILGTLAAVYGWFMEPIGWSYTLAVWGYALMWCFINDFVKMKLTWWLNLRLSKQEVI